MYEIIVVDGDVFDARAAQKSKCPLEKRENLDGSGTMPPPIGRHQDLATGYGEGGVGLR